MEISYTESMSFPRISLMLCLLILSWSIPASMPGQTPSPTPPVDTDGDGVPDSKDGWPLHKQLTSPPVPDSQYVAITLGPGVGYGLNNLGDVVGEFYDDNTGERVAAWWQLGQPPTLLGFLTQDQTVNRWSIAWGINDARQITGRSTFTWDVNVSGEYPDPPTYPVWDYYWGVHAFLWQAGTMTDLNDLSFGQSVSGNAPDPTNKLTSEGRGINRDGVVVGYSHTNASAQSTGWAWHVVYDAPHAAKFNGATPIDLGITPSDVFASGEAEAINDHGAIVGYGNYYQEAFFQSNGQTQRISPVPGANYAGSVNNLDHVVGSMGNSHAFLWVPTSNLPANQRIIDLHILGSFFYSGADGINDRDQIVGSGNGSALLWQNGKVFQLNDLIGPHPDLYLTSARAINQSGMIVASGSTDASGVCLLLPVIVRDLKEIGNDNDDRNVRAGSNIWIKPTPDSSTDASRQPQLQSQVIGLNSQFLLKWRMSTQYPRRQGEDDKKFPKRDEPNVEEVSGDQPWNIFPLYSGPDQFFGGDATIYFTVLRSHHTSVTDERSFSFKILGKNPDDAKAHQYINTVAEPLGFPWAWAIAKHESKGPTSGTFYNQFAEVNGDWGKKGEPWHNRQEGNGWGIFQRDDTGHGIPVTTDQVWNWQENVKVVLQQDDQGVLGKGELQQKRDAVDRVFNDYDAHHHNKYVQQLPPDLVVEGHTLSARDVLTMETYNGAGKIRELLVFTPANPVGVGPGKRWQWVLPPAPNQTVKPYVNLVMIESDSGP